MPTGVGAAIIAGGITLAAGAAWPVVALAVAGSLLSTYMAKPSGPTVGDAMAGRTVSGTDGLAPWQVIYGEPRVGGVITFLSLSGQNRDFLHLVVTLAGHEVEEIGTLYLDDVAVTLDGGGDATGRFAGHVHCEKATGATNQAALSSLIAATRAAWIVTELVGLGTRVDGLRLSGRGHYVETASNTTLRPATITVELRVRLLELAAGVILSMDAGAHWKLEANADGTVTFTDAAGTSVTTAAALALQTWTHIAAVGDGTSLRIYIDGTLSNTTATAYDGGTGSGVMRIGTADAKGEWFHGDVDNLRVWSVARTQPQIAAEQASETPADTTGLVGNWKLDEGSGTTAGDSVGSLDGDIRPLWTTDHRQRGRAYAYVRLKWSADLFPNGLPNIAFGVKGKRVLDPRTAQTVESIQAGADTVTITGHGHSAGQPGRFHSPGGTLDSGLAEDTDYWVISPTADTFQVATEPGGSAVDLQGDGSGTQEFYPLAWSDNPALVVADYLMDSAIGLDVPLADVDLTLLSAAANVCEESVALAAGGTEPRYRCDAAFLVNRAPQDVLDELVETMAGRLSLVGGEFGIYAGAYLTPSVTLTEDDARGPLRIRTQGRQDAFNTVKGVYPDAGNNWQPTDYPPISNATYIAEDGGEVTHELHLPHTRSAAMVQRLAKIRLERNRQGLMVEYPAKLAAYAVRPPDVVLVDNTRMGWSGKPFEVLESRLAAERDAEGNPLLGVDLLLRETASAVFDWSAGEETQVDPAPNTALPDPLLVLAPTGLVLASGTAQLYIREDGTVQPRILASWEAIQDEYVLAGGHLEVQCKRSADSDWLSLPSIDGSRQQTYIADVEDSVAYDVRVRAVSIIGAASPWATVSGHTVIGKTAPPSDVTGFSAQQNGNAVVFIWDHVTDVDLSGYDIRYGPVGTSWDDANLLTQVVKGTRVTDVAVPPSPLSGGTRNPWQFYIKAVDTSSNESTAAAAFQLVVVPPYDALVQEEQWPLWPGARESLVRNPATGNLSPESGAAADANDFALFDSYCPSPPATVRYTAPEVDVGYDDKSRVWMEMQAKRGPGETGVASVDTLLDYRLAAGSYDGYEPWAIGEATARYYSARCEDQPAADGAVLITGMNVVVDLLEHTESASVAVTDAQAGKEVTFLKAYRETPQITVTPPAGKEPSYHGLTTDGFKVWFLDSSGEPVTGTGSYEAVGV